MPNNKNNNKNINKNADPGIKNDGENIRKLLLMNLDQIRKMLPNDILDIVPKQTDLYPWGDHAEQARTPVEVPVPVPVAEPEPSFFYDMLNLWPTQNNAPLPAVELKKIMPVPIAEKKVPIAEPKVAIQEPKRYLPSYADTNKQNSQVVTSPNSIASYQPYQTDTNGYIPFTSEHTQPDSSSWLNTFLYVPNQIGKGLNYMIGKPMYEYIRGKDAIALENAYKRNDIQTIKNLQDKLTKIANRIQEKKQRDNTLKAIKSKTLQNVEGKKGTFNIWYDSQKTNIEEDFRLYKAIKCEFDQVCDSLPNWYVDSSMTFKIQDDILCQNLNCYTMNDNSDAPHKRFFQDSTNLRNEIINLQNKIAIINEQNQQCTENYNQIVERHNTMLSTGSNSVEFEYCRKNINSLIERVSKAENKNELTGQQLAESSEKLLKEKNNYKQCKQELKENKRDLRKNITKLEETTKHLEKINIEYQNLQEVLVKRKMRSFADLNFKGLMKGSFLERCFNIITMPLSLTLKDSILYENVEDTWVLMRYMNALAVLCLYFMIFAVFFSLFGSSLMSAVSVNQILRSLIKVEDDAKTNQGSKNQPNSSSHSQSPQPVQNQQNEKDSEKKNQQENGLSLILRGIGSGLKAIGSGLQSLGNTMNLPDEKSTAQATTTQIRGGAFLTAPAAFANRKEPMTLEEFKSLSANEQLDFLESIDPIFQLIKLEKLRFQFLSEYKPQKLNKRKKFFLFRKVKNLKTKFKSVGLKFKNNRILIYSALLIAFAQPNFKINSSVGHFHISSPTEIQRVTETPIQTTHVLTMKDLSVKDETRISGSDKNEIKKQEKVFQARTRKRKKRVGYFSDYLKESYTDLETETFEKSSFSQEFSKIRIKNKINY